MLLLIALLVKKENRNKSGRLNSTRLNTLKALISPHFLAYLLREHPSCSVFSQQKQLHFFLSINLQRNDFQSFLSYQLIKGKFMAKICDSATDKWFLRLFMPRIFALLIIVDKLPLAVVLSLIIQKISTRFISFSHLVNCCQQSPDFLQLLQGRPGDQLKYQYI